jgi:hypothetical protein
VAWIGFFKQQGYKKIAMLGENTDYGVGLTQGVADANRNDRLGLELKTYVFDKNVVDLTPQLLEIKNWNPDLVINIGVGNAAYLIINQAYDIKLFPEKPMLASYDFPSQPVYWQNLGDKGKYMLYILYYHPRQKLTELGETARAAYLKKYKEPPIFGSLMMMLSIARFSRTLATLLASGVALLQAMDIVKNVLDNAVLEKVVTEAIASIREGQTIADPLRKSKRFPPIVTHMIAIGEKSGQLENMLENVAIAYDSAVETRVGVLTSLLEPLMIVIMGGAVAFIAFSILMPLIQMSNFAG